MKNLKKYGILSIAFTVLLFTSCSKDGDTGPQGPQGTPGSNGINGNANVKSFQFTAVPGDWSNFGTPGQSGHCKFVEKFYAEITQEIFDTGTVLGYVRDGNYWVALPYTGFASTGQIYLSPIYRPNYFEVDFYLSTLQTPNITTSFDFKIVIVDGTAKIANQDLDWNNYELVKNRFNLK